MLVSDQQARRVEGDQSRRSDYVITGGHNDHERQSQNMERDELGGIGQDGILIEMSPFVVLVVLSSLPDSKTLTFAQRSSLFRTIDSTPWLGYEVDVITADRLSREMLRRN